MDADTEQSLTAVVSTAASEDLGLAVSSEQPSQIPTVELPDGMELDAGTARPIAVAAPTRLILLAGAVGSGKTTLLASIYERFQRGAFASYLFAGSQTLPAFEQRCHLSRITSGKSVPETERTKHVPGEQLLHLRVRTTSLDRPTQDLLVTDLSGEAFALARDSTEDCRGLTILLRADHFVLLLDGEKLIDASRRHGAVADGIGLLRSCLDATMLDEESLVDVLITKQDLLEDDSCGGRNARQYIGEYVWPEIERQFRTRVGQLRTFCVAARPARGDMEVGHGLDQVFPAWVDESPGRFHRRRTLDADPPSGRQFDRYFQFMRAGRTP